MESTMNLRTIDRSEAESFPHPEALVRFPRLSVLNQYPGIILFCEKLFAS